MKKKSFSIGAFLLVALITLGGGMLIGLLTKPSHIYQALAQPPLSPPDWLFPVAWTILYLLMSIAATLVIGSDADEKQKRSALIWYAAGLLLNFSWTPVFFGLGQVLPAFVILLLIILVTIITVVQFYKIRPAAGILLLPYLGWLIFAGYLNLAIYFVNR